ncbi:MAG: NUDIX domain-containing protein [Bacteriovoracaceae bacterium]
MTKMVPVSIALFLKDVESTGFNIWMQVRNEEGALKGKWEFPGGKIEAGELPIDAVKREVLEEVECSIDHLTRIKLFRLYPYQYGEKTICLFPFLVEEANPSLEKGQWFFVSYTEKAVPFSNKIPAANIPLINDLCDYLKTLSESGTYQYLWS